MADYVQTAVAWHKLVTPLTAIQVTNSLCLSKLILYNKKTLSTVSEHSYICADLVEPYRVV